MTYTENQPPALVTRDEVRQIATIAWAVLDDGSKTAGLSPQTRNVLRHQLVEDAKDVLGWCEGTLMSGENDAYEVDRLEPSSFRIRGYYTKDLADKLDLTPQAVLDANPVYVAILRQLAEFIDDYGLVYDMPQYSTEARLEALGDYDRILTRLQRHIAEYVAEIAAEEKNSRRRGP